MIINIAFNNNFAMNEIIDKNEYEDMDQSLGWTNLVCPSCAIYYGVQLLISGIRKKRKKNTCNISIKST